MEILSSGSSGSSDILQVYSEGVRKQTQNAQTIARINLEMKMQADQNEMVYKLLGQFYA